MCRWLAYYGDPIPIETLVFRRQNSLIDQSLHSRMGATTTNGDGFGIGWYTKLGGVPAVYRSVHPACGTTATCASSRPTSPRPSSSPTSASTGTAVQETNTHPFRHGRWLFMHNGLVREFPAYAPRPAPVGRSELLPEIEGSTDSELLFYLALTFGLEREPVEALERMAGLVEDLGEKHGVDDPLQMSVAVTDGERIIAAATRARASRGRCTSAPTRAFSRSSTGHGRATGTLRRGACRRVRAAQATWSGRGTRFRSRRSESSSPDRTSCARSLRNAESRPGRSASPQP